MWFWTWVQETSIIFPTDGNLTGKKSICVLLYVNNLRGYLETRKLRINIFGRFNLVAPKAFIIYEKCCRNYFDEFNFGTAPHRT